MADFPLRGQQAPNYWDTQLREYIDEGDNVIVLGAADPVPPGTPAGTVIVRTGA